MQPNADPAPMMIEAELPQSSSSSSSTANAIGSSSAGSESPSNVNPNLPHTTVSSSLSGMLDCDWDCDCCGCGGEPRRTLSSESGTELGVFAMVMLLESMFELAFPVPSSFPLPFLLRLGAPSCEG